MKEPKTMAQRYKELTQAHILLCRHNAELQDRIDDLEEHNKNLQELFLDKSHLAEALEM